MDTIIIPSGLIICSDTLYVDSSACLILGDISCVCAETKILGPGTVVIGIQNISSELPNSYSLSQNYPNPFNPTTKIRFDVPKQDFVTIKIFDVLGREVATLVNEQLKPGTYEVGWNAVNYTSGIYFYSIKTFNFIDSKK